MPSFRTEFHTTLDEIIDLVGKWLKTYPVVATAQRFPPVQLVPMTLDNFRDVLEEPIVVKVIFTEGLITTPAASVSQALDEHANRLYLRIERLGPTGLPQSSLATMHTTPLWSKLNRELKKMTTAGAILIYDEGMRPIDRNARFTAGAKALAASGVPLRQFAQSTNFHYMPK